ncbi:hypothetical protein GCM10023219_00240 [Stakelama sediminis]|uniref:Uncharacterized protein YhjY with autotransporter beta-barrel domain n=1 Tax=Stakelama sediminis TaxID=463200 RepID=A0A840Z186_9SPHN|nr:autotransporter domain-containing protein [Stakelama sediminis]MBB5719539.1 uncharacterized protein YhjY with autotransporter beta-barrel domain [Stakelama sediminis]
MSSSLRAYSRRSLWLASAAGICFAVTGTANAQSTDIAGPSINDSITNSYLEAQSDTSGTAPTNIYRVAQSAPITQVAPDPQIVIADPGTPSTDLDPNDITGVGQMVIDQQNGYLGLCTATLINPRTVIFAAHCVNENAATDYGAANGGKPIGFGFSNNNNQAGNSAFGNWLFGGYQTNVAQAMYNSNYVTYNPGSLEPDANGFYYSDVAMAALDTPASDVPTWSLLFSRLPAPATIDANGTGYHVTIEGYGNNGSASTGSTGGIDYRRRVAENMLGALASLNDFETFLFGSPNGLYQNLYWIDFDDPKRGTAEASPYDFNAWRDNAVPNEGTTASGDSGGPLILDDTFDQPVVIGVLSGGYTRFFNGAPPNGYGTASFYQPLYLYWDWIAANNPYHYVSAKAGDGAWSDPTHWQTDLDPAYMVIDANGNLVNGIPTAPGEGKTGSDGAFGQACYQTTAFSDCYDVGSGTETVTGDPIGTTANDKGSASTASLSSGTASASAGTTADASSPTLPDPTLTNGLPGATDFVPNNSDGDPANGIAPRYFDVTLANSGITTLSTDVTIDRLTIANIDAGLDINAGASLTSLIDITQYSGMMRVNGTLSTMGDFFLMSGGLQGSGTINAPYFTSMAGVIAPGGVGTIGTLTFNGNVGLASGTVYLVDLGSNGVSDLIAVNATTADADGNPLDGMANVGGTLVLSQTADGMVRYGNEYTVVTAEGGVTGTFDAVSPAISAILRPDVHYTANAVVVDVTAGKYIDVVNRASPIQTSYARLLDQNRAVYDKFADLYGPLDLMSVSGIRATLESYAPRFSASVRSMGVTALDSSNQIFRNRLTTTSENGDMGGTLAYYGQPMQIASVAATSPLMATSVAGNGGGQMDVQHNVLPEDMSAFVSGGYLNGHADGMPTASPYARDDFDGYFLAGGLEKAFPDSGFFGIGFSYTHVDAQPNTAGRSEGDNLYQLTFYGKTGFGYGITLDSQLSLGALNYDTSRAVAAGTTMFNLKSNDTAYALSGETGLSKAFGSAGVTITPRIAVRAAHVEFGPAVETGNGPALMYNLGNYDTIQGRGGLNLSSRLGSVQPFVSGTYVHDFAKHPSYFAANFVGGIGPDALFALPATDRDWGEISGGFRIGSERLNLAVSTDFTVGREDITNQTFRGTATIRF